MKVIGICGKSGSGKSEVLKILKSLGVPTVNTDKVSRDVMNYGEECYFALIREFGEEIVNPDKSLNRKKIFDLTFNDLEKHGRLCEITHRYILSRTDKILKSFGDIKAAAVEAPLMFESGLDKKCDILLLIKASDENKSLRIIERDGITSSDARLRLSRQIDEEELERKCDYTIINDSSLDALRDKVTEFYNKFI